MLHWVTRLVQDKRMRIAAPAIREHCKHLLFLHGFLLKVTESHWKHGREKMILVEQLASVWLASLRRFLKPTFSLAEWLLSLSSSSSGWHAGPRPASVWEGFPGAVLTFSESPFESLVRLPAQCLFRTSKLCVCWFLRFSSASWYIPCARLNGSAAQWDDLSLFFNAFKACVIVSFAVHGGWKQVICRQKKCCFVRPRSCQPRLKSCSQIISHYTKSKFKPT